MRDRQTGESVPVDFGPATLETILRSPAREHRLVLGHLRESLARAVSSLWPEFRPLPLDEPEPIVLDEWPVEAVGWTPRWRRFKERWEDRTGQGLVEYSLILALIVIVSIVVVAFLGQTVSAIISNVGESI